MSRFRKPINKSLAAKKFRRSTTYTKAANVPGRGRGTRGGIRL